MSLAFLPNNTHIVESNRPTFGLASQIDPVFFLGDIPATVPTKTLVSARVAAVYP